MSKGSGDCARWVGSSHENLIPHQWWFWTRRLRSWVLDHVFPIAFPFLAWVHENRQELEELGLARWRLLHSRVLVRCRPVTERELELEIVDDGKGLPQDFDPLTGAGLGFRLVRALTAQLGIRSGFESSVAGTRFWLRVERAPETTTGVLASSMNGLAGAANSEGS
jgi:hypothetical protein